MDRDLAWEVSCWELKSQGPGHQAPTTKEPRSLTTEAKASGIWKSPKIGDPNIVP